MSVAVTEIKKSELPFAAEIVLSDVDSHGELPLRVLTSYIDSHSYSVGSVLTDGEAEEAVEASRVCECAVVGIKLLAYADNSVRGLERKLRSRGYDRDCAACASRALADLGYINESSQIERRGRMFAERKLRGKRRIISELASLGYDRDAIAEWAHGDAEKIDFGQICARVIEKRGGMPPREDADGRRRLLQYLYRQGFGGEDIRRAALILADTDKQEM